MNRTISLLLLFLFVGSQAEGLVQLCAQWLCPERRNSQCCHQSLSAKAGAALSAASGHCSPAAAETPVELNRSFCCQDTSDGKKRLFRTADRFPRDAFRQFLLCAVQPPAGPLSLGHSGSNDGPTPQFLQDFSPSDLQSPVLRI